VKPEAPLHGFTGHKDPAIHLHTLEVAERHGFRFDAVQMPLSLLDAHYRSFAAGVVPYLVERGIAVLGMKSMAAGYLLKAGVVTPVECLHYALDLPTSVVITGIDSLGAARHRRSPPCGRSRPSATSAAASSRARTAAAGAHGAFEPFKTTSLIDATGADPSLLGEEDEPELPDVSGCG
jgi:hypothetical protein